MVSNSSSLGDDLSAVGSAIGGAATDVGQFFGLVDDDLIPGNAAETGELATHLSKLGDAFGRAGDGFKRIDTGSWHGQAADSARDYLNTAWPQWFKASECFTSAGRAVAEYQRVLADSQQKAARAKADLERAQQASDAAREAYNSRVDAYNAAAQQASNGGGPPPTPPGKFSDPAAGDIAAAEQAIKQAQEAVEAAGNRAAEAVVAATHGAPAEPGLLTQLKENFVDSAQAAGRTLGSIGAGAFGAVVDLGKLARTIAPLDPFQITHPAQYGENLATLTMGVVGAAQNPYGAVKTAVDVDGWKNDPARTMGACIPDAIASLAGGAGVASRVSRTVSKLTNNADDLGSAATHADDLARGGAPQPHVPAPQPPGPQWGRWPEPSHPNLPQAHPEPSPPQHAPVDRGWDANGDPFRSPSSSDGLVRPSELPGHHTPGPGSEMPVGRDVDGLNSRPEVHDSHAGHWPDSNPAGHPDLPSGQGHPGMPGNDAGQDFWDAMRQVDEHGDPIKLGQSDVWDMDLGSDQLPKGLTRYPIDNYMEDQRFIYEALDPANDPLYRKIEAKNLDGGIEEMFSGGISARHPDAPADLGHLGAHIAGSANQTPFISTTTELGHALSRDGGLREGDVILDIRAREAIHGDATFKAIEGDRFMSHGEGERLAMREIPGHQIRGAWTVINGQPRWVPNEHFDLDRIQMGR